jgi:hypothetical protein
VISRAKQEQTDVGVDGFGRADLQERRGCNPPPDAVNPVILALVAALRDLEERHGRGKVLTHLTSRRPAA